MIEIELKNGDLFYTYGILFDFFEWDTEGTISFTDIYKVHHTLYAWTILGIKYQAG